MLLKLLLLAAVIAAVYFIFFKPKSVAKGSSGDREVKEDQDMVECAQCGTYTTVKDALIKEGRFYCSKECLEKS